ncbi:hypothetical protein [Bradyrhizobium sp. OAE829]|uniref:hypothetical protein n=1 Tax=Bradyrhizobium sp. OAE829 TaxID=2663807 RepID=UPI00178AE300
MTIYSLEQIKAAGWLKQSNYIGGAWVAADDGRIIGVDDPATATRIGDIPWVGATETRQPSTRRTPPSKRGPAGERAALLGRMADALSLSRQTT